MASDTRVWLTEFEGETVYAIRHSNGDTLVIPVEHFVVMREAFEYLTAIPPDKRDVN